MKFWKYHGTGNDFIIVDARSLEGMGPFSNDYINALCQRHFGIGADGFILMRNAEGYDFHMDYFNSDGHRSSMCGNGARCAMHFARELGIIENSTVFLAPDGVHEGHFEGDDIAVKMNVGDSTKLNDRDWQIDTGSPHYVRFLSDHEEVDVVEAGRGIRNSDPYKAQGINVNFVQEQEGSINVATYERGVEDETLSCGTGVTASAIASLQSNGLLVGRVQVRTKGGELAVDVSELGTYLIGPAVCVFEGKLDIE